MEERVEAKLSLGRHAEIVGELEAIVAANPLAERPRGQLMLALYRSGRQAEALRRYDEAAGTQPSQSLASRDLLEQSPHLDIAPEPAAIAPQPSQPSFLPRPSSSDRSCSSMATLDSDAVTLFVGRSDQLDSAAPVDDRAVSGTPRVVSFRGPRSRKVTTRHAAHHRSPYSRHATVRGAVHRGCPDPVARAAPVLEALGMMSAGSPMSWRRRRPTSTGPASRRSSTPDGR